MDESEIHDPLMISDLFVSELGKIERTGCGTCLRFYYCVRQGTERLVVAKHVIPIAAIPAMVAYRKSIIGLTTQWDFVREHADPAQPVRPQTSTAIQ